ncbi:MAG TPA: 4a-hydroxytetrahydrobiopterin dehydratase [Pseudacidobacterium sp.]|jgi:4a-hydroxytetrahydrobiopterin dehydratase|nr:4a-hydroxytetrahydrobiopterin dehydratase [Pseudacidobacterium sp.]
MLNTADIEEKLKHVQGWTQQGKEIVREFTFENFVKAMQFVNIVAEEAEAAGHHPDIDIRYNKVRLALVSHDAGGLTERDFQLAASIDQIPTKN